MTKTQQIQHKIVEKARELRRERRWTQDSFAHLLGISQNRLSEIERDKGSFTAEQLVLLLETFNIPVSYFVPSTHKNVSSGFQNALTRFGASHLRESADVLPSERLEQIHNLVREVLVTDDHSRHITALAPVFVKNSRRLSLNKLKFDFERLGALNRLGWFLENLKEALQSEGGIEWQSKYGDAALFLRSSERSWLSTFHIEADGPDDILEAELLGVGEKTLNEVRAERSPLSKKWHILTRIQPQDFIHALREAGDAG